MKLNAILPMRTNLRRAAAALISLSVIAQPSLQTAAALTVGEAVVSIQSSNPTLPSGVANPKGNIGFLIANLFWKASDAGYDASKFGKVKPEYVDGIGTWTQTLTGVFLTSGSSNVWIGTSDPAYKLDVAGTVNAAGFRMPTGAWAGKALVSDASGNASWSASADISVTGNAATATSVPWSGITGKPTTVSGLGLTDAVTVSRALSTVAPLTGGGNLSADRTISISKATSSSDGYLSATDWGSFNGKAAANGSNASGTWWISVTGNAATATVAGNADTVDGYHQNDFVRVSPDSATPYNGTLAVGSSAGRNFIQSHAGQPLDINPLGNAVTINGAVAVTSSNFGSYAPALAGAGASGTWWIGITGNAATSTKLQTARTLSMTGDGSWSVSFDGSWNATAGMTIANSAVTSAKITDGAVGDAKVASGLSPSKLAQASASVGQVLKWSGSAWAPAPDSGITSYSETDPVWTAASGNFYTKTNLQTSGQASVHPGNLSAGTAGISVTGNAASATRLGIEDTRAGQRTPNDYSNYQLSAEFTNQITGIGDWHSVLTSQWWADGYAAWQLIGPASSSTHENWYLRSGINTAWNALRTVLHSGNSPYALAMNQNVRTSDAPTFADTYVNGWFRNNSSGVGLYNQATGNHFYSDGNYWNVGYGGTQGIRFRNGHAGTVLGYAYAETNGNSWWLSGDGNWRLRTYVGGQELYGTTYASDFRTSVTYDRDNTGYYVDPASTSNFNVVNSATENVSGVLSAGKVQLVDTATSGAACSPNGLVAKDSVGAVLSCQSGTWKSVGGSGGGSVPFFESAELDLNAYKQVVTHGLGSTPKLFQAVIRCKNAENGYSPGDEIEVTSNGYYNWAMYSMAASATELTFMTYTSTYFTVHNKTNPGQGGQFTATAANWKLVLRAWGSAPPSNGGAIGYGQSWQDVVASRAKDVVYTNSTTKPIMVAVSQGCNAWASGGLYVDGLRVSYGWVNTAGGYTLNAIVPIGSTYKYVNDTGSCWFYGWNELR